MTKSVRVESGQDVVRVYLPVSALSVEIEDGGRVVSCSDVTMRLGVLRLVREKGRIRRQVDYQWSINGAEVGRRRLRLWPRRTAEFEALGFAVVTRSLRVEFRDARGPFARIDASRSLQELRPLQPREAAFVMTCHVMAVVDTQKSFLVHLLDLVSWKASNLEGVPQPYPTEVHRIRERRRGFTAQ